MVSDFVSIFHLLAKADAPLFLFSFRRRHELSYGIKDNLKLGIVLFLQFIELAGQVGNCCPPVLFDKGKQSPLRHNPPPPDLHKLKPPLAHEPIYHAPMHAQNLRRPADRETFFNFYSLHALHHCFPSTLCLPLRYY